MIYKKQLKGDENDIGTYLYRIVLTIDTKLVKMQTEIFGNLDIENRVKVKNYTYTEMDIYSSDFIDCKRS